MCNHQLKTRRLALVLAASLLAIPALALATETVPPSTPAFTPNYAATLMMPAGSGSMGSMGSMGSSGTKIGFADFYLDNNTLDVFVYATGLSGGEYHEAHIHQGSGMPLAPGAPMVPLSVTPPGGDTFTNYPLNDYVFVASSGPSAGIFSFTHTFNLLNDTGPSDIYFPGFSETTLLPLTNDFVMIHGTGMGSTYNATAMVAMGQIHAVPEPSSLLDMLAGLAAMLALVGIGRRRMHRRKVC